MKTRILLAALLLATFSVSIFSCTKKSEEEKTDCWTCKAYGSGTNPVVTSEVCSETEEQSFRTEHAGKEISCYH